MSRLDAEMPSPAGALWRVRTDIDGTRHATGMPQREDLPPGLRDASFTVASALRAGVGEGRLRGRDLESPFYGVRAPAGSTASVLGRCRAYEPRLRPWQFFSHLTAARLWGCPLPNSSESEPLHVSGFGRAPYGRGVSGHETRDRHSRIVTRHGFPTLDAASVWCQLAAQLTLEDLVAVGDALILDPVVLDPRDPRPHLTVEQLRRRVSTFSGRGARAASTALPLLRQGAESRPETLLRLLLVSAGLPEPEVNVPVTDSSGRFLGRGDLVYREWRTVVEYDGDQHRTDTRQYDRDITRIEDFVNADWRSVRVRKGGLFVTPHGTIRRVERALRTAGWRP